MNMYLIAMFALWSLIASTSEKLGVPQRVAVTVGIIWLIVYFGWKAAEAGSLRKLFGWILRYGIGVRVFIVLPMLFVRHFQLGTHFDNSGITQFTFWMGVTLVAGFLFGLPTYGLASRRFRPGA